MPWRERLRENGCNDGKHISVVEITAALLRIASNNLAQTKVDSAEPDLSTEQDKLEKNINKILTAFFGRTPGLLIGNTTLNAICETLDASPLREGFAAFTVARMIDRHAGHLFIDAFRSAKGTRLKPGDPFPVVPFPCGRLPEAERKALLAKLRKRTGNPHTRRDSVDLTNHLRLAPTEQRGLCLRLDWADESLPSVCSETLFAFGITNTGPIGDEYEWQQYSVGTRPCFYGVVPKQPREQEQRITEILHEAAYQKVTLTVLPELCLTPEILRSLNDKKLMSPLPLVIAGSYHQHASQGPGLNICDVYAFGELIHSHRKFSDFHFAEPGEANRRHEHLQREEETSGFTLLLGSRSTAVVLICKDAIGDAGELVQKLAPTMVLVPAMSQETSDFERLARDLAHDPQAFTLVACAGPKTHVIYGRPVEHNQVISESLPAEGLVIADLSGEMRPLTIRELYD